MINDVSEEDSTSIYRVKYKTECGESGQILGEGRHEWGHQTKDL
jgi:hypothetical protein